MNQRKTTTDGGGPEVIFRYEYDTLSRMKKMYYPDGTAVNSVFAPSGHLNQITMDSRDGSIKDSPVVTYELNLDNNHKFIRTTGNDVVTEIAFDQTTNRPLSYVTKTKLGIPAEDVKLTYDAKGNITKVDDLKSPALTMNYTYDNLDRLISSQQGSLSTPVAYQYSDSGNLLKKGNIDYTYNAGSQPNAVKTAAVDNGTFTNTYYYTYDANGNMVRRNGADAASGDKMTYDSENRLTKIEDDSGNVIANYFYDQGGQRSKKILKDGSVVYEFGGIYEIAIPNGKPQQQTIYIRGLQGEIVAQMTDPAATLVTSADIENNDRYADIKKITTDEHRWTRIGMGGIGGAVIEALEMTTTLTSLKSSLKHFINRHVVLNSKLLFQDHASLAYILGGNRLSDKTRITVLLLFVMMLFYLLLNPLSFPIRALHPTPSPGAGGILESNRYNPFITFSTPLVLTTFLLTFSLGGCIGLTKHSSQTPWGALGLGAINGNTPTLGAGGSGSSSSGFGTPGQGGGSTGSGMGGEGTPVAGMYFFHNDQIGSTKIITNSAGEMVTGSNGAANIVYNPYGDIDVDHSHGPDILRNKFTGQQLDNESGLYYYNARYYDPALGRFITADSVTDAGGDPDGMNAYMYVGGNPLKFNDPSGHIKSSQLKQRMIQDITSAAISNFASQNTDNQILTQAYLNHQKQKADKRAARQEWTHAVIAAVVLVVAVVLTVVTVNPVVGYVVANVGLAAGGIAGFAAGVLVGTVMGAAVGAISAELGGAMAVGFNGKSDYKAGKQVGAVAGTVGGFIGGFIEVANIDPVYDFDNPKTTVHNEEQTTYAKVNKSKTNTKMTKMTKMTTMKSVKTIDYPITKYQLGSIHAPTITNITEKFFLESVVVSNVAQDRITDAYKRTQPQPQ